MWWLYSECSWLNNNIREGPYFQNGVWVMGIQFMNCKHDNPFWPWNEKNTNHPQLTYLYFARGLQLTSYNDLSSSKRRGWLQNAYLKARNSKHISNQNIFSWHVGSFFGDMNRSVVCVQIFERIENCPHSPFVKKMGVFFVVSHTYIDNSPIFHRKRDVQFSIAHMCWYSVGACTLYSVHGIHPPLFGGFRHARFKKIFT